MKVVVVGAGIVGTSTAYHLACKGADVFLVDRKDEGQATAAGAGIRVSVAVQKAECQLVPPGPDRDTLLCNAHLPV